MDEFPFQDFRAPYLELKEELDAAYQRFMNSGHLVLGDEVSGFEAAYASFCGADHAVGLSSGLDALHLALRAAGIGPGDEVVVPSNTYIATWLAVHHAGASPVPVEPDPATFNIDPARIPSALGPQTKAILAVNLYGLPSDYPAIESIARQHGLVFLTDNAQAQGAICQGRPVGGLADLECHSFYPSKNLGAFGEAGAVTTNHATWAETLLKLRHYGARERNHHEIAGFNARLDELQAAFLCVRLHHLPEWNTRRVKIAALYMEALSGIPDLTLPIQPDGLQSAWHQFVIRHPRRDALRAHLAAAGIPTMVHYPVPPHLSGAFRHLGYREGAFPVAETMARQMISLPIHAHLGEERAHRVVEALVGFEG